MLCHVQMSTLFWLNSPLLQVVRTVQYYGTAWILALLCFHVLLVFATRVYIGSNQWVRVSGLLLENFCLFLLSCSFRCLTRVVVYVLIHDQPRMTD
jgi:hypothetical protein